MDKTFGEKIRELREEADMTQGTLGRHLRMTQRKISYIECGKYEPGIDDIKTFCLFFDVSADYLLGLTDLPTKSK